MATTKRILSVILTIGMLASFVAFAFAKDKGEFGVLELFGKNQTATIYVEKDSPQTDYFAAAVISDYFNRMTGVEPRIVKGDYSGSKCYIAIGSPEYTNLITPAENGYIISSDSQGVKIARSGNKGAARGAYAFLENYCGCHWYAHDCIVAPKKDRISVPDNIRVNYKPYFEYGECDTMSARVPEFNVANGGSGGSYCVIPEVMGGTVSYISNFCHTLTTQFCSAEKYFDAHPEYFALHNGERSRQQLCLTNPDTIQIVLDEVMALLKQSHNPNAPLQIISLTQNDSGAEGDYCQCPNCKALDDENGSHAGSNIYFANTIAAEVAKAGYKNVAIDTFAYRYTRTCPTSIKPLDNVIVRLCSIECCFGHTIADESCKQNVQFMADLKAWGKICNRVYVWDYVNNYNHTISVFPNFGTLQSNMQTFYENGVKGIYEEGNYYINRSDSEFGEMKTYLLTKLMNNPYCDLEKEIDGFLEAYYGSGWKCIKEYIGIITKRAVTDKVHLDIYQDAQDSLPGITNREIQKCTELFEKAKTADATEEQIARINRSEISWRVWKCFNKKGEFSRWQIPHKWIKAQDELYNDMKKMGVVQIGECWDGTRDLSDVEVLHYILSPDCWAKGDEGKPIASFNDFAVKIFHFMNKITWLRNQ
ncbi:MAG TPA: hypothetical protein DDY98_03570 [Ruminococcaceae bacterium]|nr:hypothetical protein [Oscillospiraceae bacterium]